MSKPISFQDQVHFMSRQAELLDEQGNDVSAGVMRDAMKALSAEHQRAERLDTELRAANERLEKAVDEAGERIMKMTDKQIEALCRLEGHDPKDQATIARQAGQIAMLRVELDQARATPPEAAVPDTIPLPRSTLERWKDAIGPYWFGSDGEDEYNNDEIIALSREITELLAAPAPLAPDKK